MEGSDGSPPHSMWMVRVGELYPKPTLEKEEEKLAIPFTEREYYMGGKLGQELIYYFFFTAMKY